MDSSAATDRTARLIEARRRETPDVPLDGMEVFARARRLTDLSRRWIEAAFKRHDLDTGAFDVLATLQRTGPPYELRPTDLFRELMMSSGGLTDRLDRLEGKGLVERLRSEHDQRSVVVRLTALGLRVIRKAFADDMHVENDLLTSLDDTERMQLASLLRKLLADLEERMASPSVGDLTMKSRGSDGAAARAAPLQRTNK